MIDGMIQKKASVFDFMSAGSHIRFGLKWGWKGPGQDNCRALERGRENERPWATAWYLISQLEDVYPSLRVLDELGKLREEGIISHGCH